MKKFTIILLLFSSLLFGQTEQLPKWEKGYLDMHFINTGRGNAAFYILPDGTTLLVDAGDLPPTDSARRSTAVPDNSKTPAEWIADYIFQFHPDGKNAKLDYALITHYHDDHFGHFDNTVKIHPEGKYKLSGITELGSIIPIKILIDRGFDWPVNFKDPNVQAELKSTGEAAGILNAFQEYWKFIDYKTKTGGMIHQKFKVGSTSQIELINDPAAFPEFEIKNLFSDGDIASSWDTTVSIRKYKEGEYPGENDLACGIRISYGKFHFYTGADIPGINYIGGSDFHSMEALAAPVIGPVDVATLDHHGNRDSQNEYFVRTIRPRVWIGQSWSANHPDEEVLRRITSQDVYPGERDLFTNFMHPANKTVLSKKFLKYYKSFSGHIVVRVYPKGERYDVFVLNDKSTDRKVLACYHYKSR